MASISHILNFFRTHIHELCGKRNFFKRIFHSIRNCKEIGISFFKAKVIFIIPCGGVLMAQIHGWSRCFFTIHLYIIRNNVVINVSPTVQWNARWMRKIRCVLWCGYFIVRNEKDWTWMGIIKNVYACVSRCNFVWDGWKACQLINFLTFSSKKSFKCQISNVKLIDAYMKMSQMYSECLTRWCSVNNQQN
jgi:hypothetical protein